MNNTDPGVYFSELLDTPEFTQSSSPKSTPTKPEAPLAPSLASEESSASNASVSAEEAAPVASDSAVPPTPMAPSVEESPLALPSDAITTLAQPLSQDPSIEAEQVDKTREASVQRRLEADRNALTDALAKERRLVDLIRMQEQSSEIDSGIYVHSLVPDQVDYSGQLADVRTKIADLQSNIASANEIFSPYYTPSGNILAWTTTKAFMSNLIGGAYSDADFNISLDTAANYMQEGNPMLADVILERIAMMSVFNNQIARDVKDPNLRAELLQTAVNTGNLDTAVKEEFTRLRDKVTSGEYKRLPWYATITDYALDTIYDRLPSNKPELMQEAVGTATAYTATMAAATGLARFVGRLATPGSALSTWALRGSVFSRQALHPAAIGSALLEPAITRQATEYLEEFYPNNKWATAAEIASPFAFGIGAEVGLRNAMSYLDTLFAKPHLQRYAPRRLFKEVKLGLLNEMFTLGTRHPNSIFGKLQQVASRMDSSVRSNYMDAVSIYAGNLGDLPLSERLNGFTLDAVSNLTQSEHELYMQLKQGQYDENLTEIIPSFDDAVNAASVEILPYIQNTALRLNKLRSVHPNFDPVGNPDHVTALTTVDPESLFSLNYEVLRELNDLVASGVPSAQDLNYIARQITESNLDYRYKVIAKDLMPYILAGKNFSERSATAIVQAKEFAESYGRAVRTFLTGEVPLADLSPEIQQIITQMRLKPVQLSDTEAQTLHSTLMDKLASSRRPLDPKQIKQYSTEARKYLSGEVSLEQVSPTLRTAIQESGVDPGKVTADIIDKSVSNIVETLEVSGHLLPKVVQSNYKLLIDETKKFYAGQPSLLDQHEWLRRQVVDFVTDSTESGAELTGVFQTLAYQYTDRRIREEATKYNRVVAEYGVRALEPTSSLSGVSLPDITTKGDTRVAAALGDTLKRGPEPGDFDQVPKYGTVGIPTAYSLQKAALDLGRIRATPDDPYSEALHLFDYWHKPPTVSTSIFDPQASILNQLADLPYQVRQNINLFPDQISSQAQPPVLPGQNVDPATGQLRVGPDNLTPPLAYADNMPIEQWEAQQIANIEALNLPDTDPLKQKLNRYKELNPAYTDYLETAEQAFNREHKAFPQTLNTLLELGGSKIARLSTIRDIEAVVPILTQAMERFAADDRALQSLQQQLKAATTEASKKAVTAEINKIQSFRKTTGLNSAKEVKDLLRRIDIGLSKANLSAEDLYSTEDLGTIGALEDTFEALGIEPIQAFNADLSAGISGLGGSERADRSLTSLFGSDTIDALTKLIPAVTTEADALRRLGASMQVIDQPETNTAKLVIGNREAIIDTSNPLAGRLIRDILESRDLLLKTPKNTPAIKAGNLQEITKDLIDTYHRRISPVVRQTENTQLDRIKNIRLQGVRSEIRRYIDALPLDQTLQKVAEPTVTKTLGPDTSVSKAVTELGPKSDSSLVSSANEAKRLLNQYAERVLDDLVKKYPDAPTDFIIAQTKAELQQISVRSPFANWNKMVKDLGIDLDRRKVIEEAYNKPKERRSAVSLILDAYDAASPEIKEKYAKTIEALAEVKPPTPSASGIDPTLGPSELSPTFSPADAVKPAMAEKAVQESEEVKTALDFYNDLSFNFTPEIAAEIKAHLAQGAPLDKAFYAMTYDDKEKVDTLIKLQSNITTEFNKRLGTQYGSWSELLKDKRVNSILTGNQEARIQAYKFSASEFADQTSKLYEAYRALYGNNSSAFMRMIVDPVHKDTQRIYAETFTNSFDTVVPINTSPEDYLENFVANVRRAFTYDQPSKFSAEHLDELTKEVALIQRPDGSLQVRLPDELHKAIGTLHPDSMARDPLFTDPTLDFDNALNTEQMATVLPAIKQFMKKAGLDKGGLNDITMANTEAMARINPFTVPIVNEKSLLAAAARSADASYPFKRTIVDKNLASIGIDPFAVSSSVSRKDRAVLTNFYMSLKQDLDRISGEFIANAREAEVVGTAIGRSGAKSGHVLPEYEVASTSMLDIIVMQRTVTMMAGIKETLQHGQMSKKTLANLKDLDIVFFNTDTLTNSLARTADNIVPGFTGPAFSKRAVDSLRQPEVRQILASEEDTARFSTLTNPRGRTVPTAYTIGNIERTHGIKMRDQAMRNNHLLQTNYMLATQVLDAKGSRLQQNLDAYYRYISANLDESRKLRSELLQVSDDLTQLYSSPRGNTVKHKPVLKRSH